MPALIVLGDKTDHGGEVIEASMMTDTYGRYIARVGDKVRCPKKGHGMTQIVQGDLAFVIDGKGAAYHGCKTSCGAIVISSQSLVTVEFGGGSGTGSGASDSSGVIVERRAAFADTALQAVAESLPLQTLEIRIVDPDEQSPSSEPLALFDGSGTEHTAMAASGTAQINSFKPGATRVTQPRRMEEFA